MPWHWDCLWPVPSEPSDCGLRLKSSRKESWPSLPHSSFFPWHLQEGNAWFSSSCSQRCTCQAGAIQCRAFACPASSRCETDEDGKEICKPYSKGALRRCSRGGEPRLGALGSLDWGIDGSHSWKWSHTGQHSPDPRGAFLPSHASVRQFENTPVTLSEDSNIPVLRDLACCSLPEFCGFVFFSSMFAVKDFEE